MLNSINGFNPANAKLDSVKSKLTNMDSCFSKMLNTEMHNKKPQDQKLWDSCIEAESLFVGQMLKGLKKTVEKGELFHGGQAEEYFEDMLYNEYSLSVSKNSNLGLAKQLYDQLSKTV